MLFPRPESYIPELHTPLKIPIKRYSKNFKNHSNYKGEKMKMSVESERVGKKEALRASFLIIFCNLLMVSQRESNKPS